MPLSLSPGAHGSLHLHGSSEIPGGKKLAGSRALCSMKWMILVIFVWGVASLPCAPFTLLQSAELQKSTVVDAVGSAGLLATGPGLFPLCAVFCSKDFSGEDRREGTAVGKSRSLRGRNGQCVLSSPCPGWTASPAGPGVPSVSHCTMLSCSLPHFLLPFLSTFS